MQPTNDALTNSFQLLTSIVREFEATARPCLGATLKPRLDARGFDDKRFGFRKFGDFLRSAAAAGHVRLSATPGGDISISLPSSAPTNLVPRQTVSSTLPQSPFASAAAAVNPMSPVKIRQDLWNAFNSFSDKWLYDLAQDRAFKDTVGVGIPGTIAIPPGGERIKEWMEAYSNMQGPDAKARLSSVVETAGDLYQFGNAIRVFGLQRSWSQFHTQKVAAAIQAWAATNNIQPKSVVMPFHAPPRLPSVPETTSANPAPSDPPAEVARQLQTPSTELNSKLESLIDALINELISLRGLLQVAGSKRS